MPAEFDAPAVARLIQKMAAASAIDAPVVQRVGASEKIVLADGRATPHERVLLDLSGQADFSSLGIFLDRLSRLPLIVELHSITLEAAGRWSVRYTVRLGIPTYVGWPTIAVGEEQRERLHAEVAAMSEMRDRAPTRFPSALAQFQKALKDQPLVLTRAHFGPAATVEGVVVGALARAALPSAFAAAGFVVERLEVAPSGDCRAFTLTGRLSPPAEDVVGAPPFEIGPSQFDSRKAPSCATVLAPSRGKAAASGTAGDLTVRLRGVDLADAFKVLADLSGESFVVDSNVEGRVDLDLSRATLDEALGALRQTGISVGAGPLRRVSMGNAVPALSRSGSREQPVSLSFRNAALIDILRLFQEISGQTIWTAPVADGRVSIFATDVPWDTALEGIAASAGWTALFEAGRIFVGPPAMAQAPGRSGAVVLEQAKATSDHPSWARIPQPMRLAIEDLTLVGLSSSPGGPKGIFHGPGRLLWILAPGDALGDGKLEAVRPDGVTFVSASGRKIELRLSS